VSTFGLHFRFSTCRCPNTASIRTQIPIFNLVLSEHSLHSDSDSDFQSGAVRRQPSFGLRFRFSICCCPNPTLIRTQIPIFNLLLSEDNPHSDSDSDFQSVAVRRQPSFGLRFRFSICCCTNPALIRTQIPIFNLMLSEDNSHSDSDSDFQSGAVRTQLSFGLRFRFSICCCPKTTLIRT
jgi:hypothetical protein